MKRVPVNGGAAVVIGEVPPLNGGISWDEDDSILYVPGFQAGIWEVAASGAEVRKPSSNRTRTAARAAMYGRNCYPGTPDSVTIGPDSIASMDDAVLAVRGSRNETRVILKGGTGGRLLPTGHLVYGHSQSLLAAAFAGGEHPLAGNPVPVVDGVAMRQANGSVRYAVSNSGTLVYVTSAAVDRSLSLVLASRQGNFETLATYTDYSDIDQLALSPDGKKLAFRVAKANDDIHIFNLERKITSRLTFEGGDKINPTWTPDGGHIAYTNARGNGETLMWRRIDPRGEPEPILPAGQACNPSSFFDGKTLACTKTDPKTGADLWMVQMAGGFQARPFLRTSFNETSAVFSPDGRWLAYSSDESGAMQVYAIRYPDGGGRVEISTGGGTEPLWAADGRELFYRNGDRVLAVAVSGHPVLAVGTPQFLFSGVFVHAPEPAYAVTRDGRHFVMVKGKRY